MDLLLIFYKLIINLLLNTYFAESPHKFFLTFLFLILTTPLHNTSFIQKYNFVLNDMIYFNSECHK